MYKELQRYIIYGIIFVSLLGTFSHFLYDWCDNNKFIALFTPTSESVWEHIKLIYFPMLIYTIFAYIMLKSNYPYILSALLLGLIIGFLLIPIIFYVYSGILGYNLLIVDISSFYLSVIIAFYFSYKLAILYDTRNLLPFLIVIVISIALSFFIFTYYPPNIALFSSEFS